MIAFGGVIVHHIKYDFYTCFVQGFYHILSKRLHRLGPPSYTIIDRQSGFRIAKLIQETNACVVTARAARRLTVENDSPGLQVIRRYFDDEGVTLMVANTVYPAGRYSFSFAINLPRD